MSKKVGDGASVTAANVVEQGNGDTHTTTNTYSELHNVLLHIYHITENKTLLKKKKSHYLPTYENMPNLKTALKQS